MLRCQDRANDRGSKYRREGETLLPSFKFEKNNNFFLFRFYDARKETKQELKLFSGVAKACLATLVSS